MLELIFLRFFLALCSNYILVLRFMSLAFLYLIIVLFDSGMYLFKSCITLLSLWLMMMILISVNFVDQRKLLLNIFILLLIILEVCFFCDSLIIFYLIFECSVVPVFLIIFGWGYQSSRIDAGIYILRYTVLFSFPLLIIIILLGVFTNFNSLISFIFFTSAFMVKFPLFGVHLWLPRAHVEAPVYGSIILAGVILKLGGYGLIKLGLLLGDLIIKFSLHFIVYRIVGSLYVSFICLLQRDMKILIAYSSIVHIGLVFSGLLTIREVCVNGRLIIMIGHGLCSSGLFFMVGSIFDRTHRRRILINRGLTCILPLFSLFWFIFCSSNLSFPPCLNFVGEILLLVGIVSWNFYIIFLLFFLGFFSSLYRIFLFSFLQQGGGVLGMRFKILTLKEFLVILFHWVPLNVLILDLKFMFW